MAQDMHTDMAPLAGNVQQVCDAGKDVQSASSSEGRDVIQQQIE